MFGELAGGKGFSGGQEKEDWMVHRKEDRSELGMKFEGRPKAAQKAGRWFRRVEEGAESFMRKWHGAESCRTAERHAKAAAAPSTVGISKRPGGEGRGGGGRGGKGARPAQETEVWVWPSSSCRLFVGLPMAVTS